MLPIALLLRARRAVFFVACVYAYSFLWAFFVVTEWAKLPSPAIIPSVVLLVVLAYLIYSAFEARRTSAPTELWCGANNRPSG